jgi:hypothetical protein
VARPATVWGFFFAALAWFLALTLLWMQVSAWTSYPAGGLAHIVLGNGAAQWVRAVHKEPGRIEVDTRVVVPAAAQGNRQAVAELIAEVETARYAYGLPLFLALLFAARLGRSCAGRAGYAILLAQAFSLVFSVLKQVIVAGGSRCPRGCRLADGSIALGYRLAACCCRRWLDGSTALSFPPSSSGWLARNPAAASTADQGSS